MKYQRGALPIPVILVILLVLAVGAGAFYFGKSTSSPITLSPSPQPTATSTPQPTATTTLTPTATPTPTPTATPNSNYFISQDLGISFYYTKKSTGINNSKIAVKEIGNKIFVYSTSGIAENGQYLEMFSKDKNQTLIEAIKTKILTGFVLSDCQLKTITETFTGQSYPANFELAQITVPVSPNDDMENLSQKAEKCPKNYTAVGGLSYFLMDSNHPDKFIFLSIGQYAIDSGIGDKNWQTTIQFLP